MKKNGFVLFVVLLYLVMLSMIGTSMFGTMLQGQGIGGSFRETDRAFAAAVAPMIKVESWLGQPANVYVSGWATGIPCTTAQVYTNQSVVFSNPVPSARWPSSWTCYSTYSLSTNTTVNTNNNQQLLTTAGSGANAFSSDPQYYIYYLSTVSTPTTALYQVNVASTGGNQYAVAVIQAVYQVTLGSRDIGG